MWTWGHVWGHVWGHGDTGTQQAPLPAVPSMLQGLRLALAERLRVSAVNCRQ